MVLTPSPAPRPGHTGDDGQTGLGDGSRVSKSDPRVAALGDVDELHSAIGLLRAFGLPDGPLHPDRLMAEVQQDLLDLGGELSIPGYTLLPRERVAALDAWLAAAHAGRPPSPASASPGPTVAGAQAQVCRTVCRRAERSVVTLGEVGATSAVSRQYLNRLSELLRVLARLLNAHP